MNLDFKKHISMVIYIVLIIQFFPFISAVWARKNTIDKFMGGGCQLN